MVVSKVRHGERLSLQPVHEHQAKSRSHRSNANEGTLSDTLTRSGSDLYGFPVS